MEQNSISGPQLWRVVVPLLAGGVAFALGGVGPGLFTLALAGIASAAAGRFQGMSATQSGDQANGTAHVPTSSANMPSSPERRRQLAARFLGCWLVSIVAFALAVPLAYAGSPAAGTAVLVCGLVVVISGAIALVVMRRRGA